MPFADPTEKRDYQRNLMRERRAGERGSRRRARALTVVRNPFTVEQAEDVRELLREQVEAVRADTEASACERARCIGYLAGVLLRSVEATDLTARLDALEAELKNRAAA